MGASGISIARAAQSCDFLLLERPFPMRRLRPRHRYAAPQSVPETLHPEIDDEPLE